MRGAAGETIILYGSAAQQNEQAARLQRACSKLNNPEVERESADEYEGRCPPPQPLTQAETTYLHERGLLDWRPPAPTSHAAASAGARVRTRLMGLDQSGGLVRLVFESPAGEHCLRPRVAPLELDRAPAG